VPYNANQWAAVIGSVQNRGLRAQLLIQVWELQKVSPVGLDPNDQTYQLGMSIAQRQAIRSEFLSIVDSMIVDLTTARDAP